MGKGKTKTGRRSGSDSNNASRASASDRRHDRKQMLEDKSIKLGTDVRGKLKDWQGGSKNEPQRK
jgi:hypothetical protein